MLENQEVEFEIAGGLGNQLFMMYAGIHFQKRFNKRVRFDVSDLRRISVLHPGHNVLTLGLLQNYLVKSSTDRLAKRRLFREKIESKICTFARLRHFFNQSKTFTSPELGYLDLQEIPKTAVRVKGYFQSWRYSYPLLDNLVNEIERNVNFTDWYLYQVESISQKPFAAFHVRRGDYKAKINKEIGILSLSYFQKIEKLLPPDVQLLIFTDEVEDVKKEFTGWSREFIIVEPPTDSDPIESLLLMSRASYLAISNSTYSWWAAALTNPSAIVYAPKKWFFLRRDPIDLLPDGWIRVQSEWD